MCFHHLLAVGWGVSFLLLLGGGVRAFTCARRGGSGRGSLPLLGSP